jgi:hypothetical protein
LFLARKRLSDFFSCESTTIRTMVFASLVLGSTVRQIASSVAFGVLTELAVGGLGREAVLEVVGWDTPGSERAFDLEWPDEE